MSLKWLENCQLVITSEKHIRFRNMVDFESYLNAFKIDYDSEDVTFNGNVYEINTPQLSLVNRSQYGNGCDFRKETTECLGNRCFTPTKGYCFVKCIRYLAGEDCKQQYLVLSEKKKDDQIL